MNNNNLAQNLIPNDNRLKQLLLHGTNSNKDVAKKLVFPSSDKLTITSETKENTDEVVKRLNFNFSQEKNELNKGNNKLLYEIVVKLSDDDQKLLRIYENEALEQSAKNFCLENELEETAVGTLLQLINSEVKKQQLRQPLIIPNPETDTKINLISPFSALLSTRTSHENQTPVTESPIEQIQPSSEAITRSTNEKNQQLQSIYESPISPHRRHSSTGLNRKYFVEARITDKIKEFIWIGKDTSSSATALEIWRKYSLKETAIDHIILFINKFKKEYFSSPAKPLMQEEQSTILMLTDHQTESTAKKFSLEKELITTRRENVEDETGKLKEFTFSDGRSTNFSEEVKKVVTPTNDIQDDSNKTKSPPFPFSNRPSEMNTSLHDNWSRESVSDYLINPTIPHSGRVMSLQKFAAPGRASINRSKSKAEQDLKFQQNIDRKSYAQSRKSNTSSSPIYQRLHNEAGEHEHRQKELSKKTMNKECPFRPSINHSIAEVEISTLELDTRFESLHSDAKRRMSKMWKLKARNHSMVDTQTGQSLFCPKINKDYQMKQPIQYPTWKRDKTPENISQAMAKIMTNKRYGPLKNAIKEKELRQLYMLFQRLHKDRDDKICLPAAVPTSLESDVGSLLKKIGHLIGMNVKLDFLALVENVIKFNMKSKVIEAIAKTEPKHKDPLYNETEKENIDSGKHVTWDLNHQIDQKPGIEHNRRITPVMGPHLTPHYSQLLPNKARLFDK
jgi:hypothetical protein